LSLYTAVASVDAAERVLEQLPSTSTIANCYYCSARELILTVCHCIQRLRALTQPSVYWGPALVEHRQLVDYVEHFVVDPWTHTDYINDTQLTLAQAIDDNVRISCFHGTTLC